MSNLYLCNSSGAKVASGYLINPVGRTQFIECGFRPKKIIIVQHGSSASNAYWLVYDADESADTYLQCSGATTYRTYNLGSEKLKSIDDTGFTVQGSQYVFAPGYKYCYIAVG